MNTAKAQEILGLVGSPSLADIKKAYRQQVKIWHPDRYSQGSTLKRLAEKNIQDANLAYAFLKQQVPAPPRKRRSAASERTPPPDFPSSPSDAMPRPKGDRLLAALQSIDPAKVLRHIFRWPQNAPQYRFRPWYRYPASSGTSGDRNRIKSFDHVLKDAMQRRVALNRIDRAHGRRSGRQGNDRVMSVTAVAKPFKPEVDSSSGK
jgi:hypothetical protein